MQTKMDDARQRSKQQAMKIAVDKASNKGRYKTGISSSDYQSSTSNHGSVTTDTDSRDEPRHIGYMNTQQTAPSKGFGKTTPNSPISNDYPSSYSSKTSEQPKQINPSRMILKPKSKQSSSLVKDLIREGEVDEEDVHSPTRSAPTEDVIAPTASSRQPEIAREGVHVTLEEKVRAEVNHEGGPAKIDIKGEMFLTINEGGNGNIRVKLNKDRASESQFATKLHPNIDKKPFSEQSLLGLKNTKRAFPTGTPLKILTWRLQNSDDESVLPLTISSWPNASNDGVSVSVEYELTRKDMELQNLVIIIPIPQQDRGVNVNVETIEHGSYKFDQKNSELIWTLDDIDTDSHASGSLEFTVPSGDESGFFPINVQFTSRQTLSQIRVDDVITVEGNDRVKYSLDQKLVVAEYHIV
jgi:hypothetical protein